MSANKPLLIIITGRPGSGKTTLAHTLAKELRCPVLSRDEFKEGLVNTFNSSHKELGPDVNLTIYNVFFQAAELLLKNNITLIIEAAFQHKNWTQKLEPLLPAARACVILCSVDPQTARERYIQRGLSDANRERFHGDFGGQAATQEMQLPIADYENLKLPVPTLEVDTSNDYQPAIKDIVSFIMQTKAEADNAPC
jgi:predicted kinase